MLKKIIKYFVRLKLEKETYKQIAQSELMIDFYGSFVTDNEEDDAKNKLKIKNLEDAIAFNQSFLDFLNHDNSK